jgi:hypothetical protein
MGISSIGSVPAAISQAETGDGLAIAALRKALDIQAQSALQLIQALPQPVASGPANLGQGVNTFA